MSFFRERKSAGENIAFMALASALNAIFAVILAFVPFSDLFLVLFLPLVSALVGLLCAPKYLPIYLFAAIGVCLASTAYDMQATIFYIIPAILSGTLYGFLYHKKLPTPYVILFTALLELGLMALGILLVKAIYNNDIIAFFLQVLGLSSHPHIRDIILAFLLSYALAQTALSHFLIQGFFSRFHLDNPENEKLLLSYPIGGICCGSLSILLAWFSPMSAYFFLVITLYLSSYSCLLFKNRFVWWIYLILGVLELGSLYAFAFLYGQVPNDGGLALSAFFFFSLDSVILFGRLLWLRAPKGDPR